MLVPAEWRKVLREEPPGTVSTFMADPKHKPGNAVTFSVYSIEAEPGANTAFALGAVLVDTLKRDKEFSNVRSRIMHLPSVVAVQVGFDVTLKGRKFTGFKYALVHSKKAYLVTYEAIRARASHIPQFLASARSMQYTRGPYEPDIRTVTVARTPTGVISLQIRFRSPVALDWDRKLQVMLDTDKDHRTGIQGAEYALDFSSPAPNSHAPPTVALLTARGGNAQESRPRSLTFSSTRTSATFRIADADIGHSASFDFWTFINVNAADSEMMADFAPSNVGSVFAGSPAENPWTYPKKGTRSRNAYPTQTYVNP